MSSLVSPYCFFRTLRSQAKRYAKVPERVLMTVEYTPPTQERNLYELLYTYINHLEKKSFLEINQYDLALCLRELAQNERETSAPGMDFTPRIWYTENQKNSMLCDRFWGQPPCDDPIMQRIPRRSAPWLES